MGCGASANTQKSSGKVEDGSSTDENVVHPVSAPERAESKGIIQKISQSTVGAIHSVENEASHISNSVKALWHNIEGLSNDVVDNAAAGIRFMDIMGLTGTNVAGPDKVAPPTKLGPCKESSWKAATWNAAAEVKKFEFLPIQNAFCDALEKLVGTAIMDLRGLKKESLTDDKAKFRRWARYAPPQPVGLELLINLDTSDLLEGFDANQLFNKWKQWETEKHNTGGAALIQEHVEHWRHGGALRSYFRTALAKCVTKEVDDDDDDLHEQAKKIPGLAQAERAIISNPDSWFQNRKYHIRGDLWADFIKDSSNPSFTAADFWKKWIDNLSEVYYWKNKGEEYPIEFAPSKPGYDYVCVAMWDRFIFLAAQQVCQTDVCPKEWEGFHSSIDVPPETIVKSVNSITEWTINTAKVDVLFLQEGSGLTPPPGWVCQPYPNAATAIWMEESTVCKDSSDHAQKALESLKQSMCKAAQHWEEMESAIRKETLGSVTKTAETKLKALALEKEVQHSLMAMATAAADDLGQKLDDIFSNAPNLKQLTRIKKWFDLEDKIAVAVMRKNESCTLLMSAHGESMGTTATAILALARALRDNLQDVLTPKLCMGVIVGMDANVKVDNEGASATPEKLIETAKALGFSSGWPGSKKFLNAGTDELADCTVSKTRGFLQPQLKGKAGIVDENHKDFIFYLPPDAPHAGCITESMPARELYGRVLNEATPNDKQGRYHHGGMPLGTDWPSDHAMVVMEYVQYDN